MYLVIAILCPLSSFDPRYSVASCVKTQLNYFRNKHDVKFITTSDFNEPDKNAAKFTRWDYCPSKQVDDTEYIKKIEVELKEALKGVTKLIVHDVYFITQFRPLANALNQAIKNLKIELFVWSHSVPTGFAEVIPSIPAKYASLSRADSAKIADYYDTTENNVFYCPNPIDPKEYFDWTETMSMIYDTCRLWERDIIITYPVRTHPSKQPDMILRIIKGLKDLGFNVFFIFANSYVQAKEAPVILAEIDKLIKQFELEDNVLITATLGKDYLNGLDKKTVKNLLDYSDLFIFPSLSEGCSLSLLEASLSKNFMVLNESVPSLAEHAGYPIGLDHTDRSYVSKLGNLKMKLTGFFPDEETWNIEKAKEILDHLLLDKSLNNFRFVRKERNPESVYSNHLPLSLSLESFKI